MHENRSVGVCLSHQMKYVLCVTHCLSQMNETSCRVLSNKVQLTCISQIPKILKTPLLISALHNSKAQQCHFKCEHWSSFLAERALSYSRTVVHFSGVIIFKDQNVFDFYSAQWLQVWRLVSVGILSTTSLHIKSVMLYKIDTYQFTYQEWSDHSYPFSWLTLTKMLALEGEREIVCDVWRHQRNTRARRTSWNSIKCLAHFPHPLPISKKHPESFLSNMNMFY